MALLPDDKDKLIQGGDPTQAGQSTPAPGGQTTPVGGAFVGGGGGVSQAGVGPGGQGSWTNIQSYLDANKGNTSSSKLVDDVGSKLEADRKNLTDSASDAKSKAQSGVDATNVNQDKASQLISEASQAGKGTDTYNQNTGQLKGALNYNYDGPQNFAYALNPKTEDYGTGLAQNNFGNFMEGLYRDSSGGTLTNGQLNLQRQLDLDEPAANAIEAARQSALQKYAGLKSDYESVVPATNTALQNSVGQINQNKSNLGGYLSGQQSSDWDKLQGLLNDFNFTENRIKTGQESSGIDRMPESQYEYFYQPESGTYGDWKQLTPGDYRTYTAGTEANAENVGGGDPYRNEYNTVADVLGTGQTLNTGLPEATHGTSVLDNNAYEDAWKNIENQMLASGKSSQLGRMNEFQKQAYDRLTGWSDPNIINRSSGGLRAY